MISSNLSTSSISSEEPVVKATSLEVSCFQGSSSSEESSRDASFPGKCSFGTRSLDFSSYNYFPGEAYMPYEKLSVLESASLESVSSRSEPRFEEMQLQELTIKSESVEAPLTDLPVIFDDKEASVAEEDNAISTASYLWHSLSDDISEKQQRREDSNQDSDFTTLIEPTSYGDFSNYFESWIEESPVESEKEHSVQIDEKIVLSEAQVMNSIEVLQSVSKREGSSTTEAKSCRSLTYSRAWLDSKADCKYGLVPVYCVRRQDRIRRVNNEARIKYSCQFNIANRAGDRTIITGLYDTGAGECYINDRFGIGLAQRGFGTICNLADEDQFSATVADGSSYIMNRAWRADAIDHNGHPRSLFLHLLPGLDNPPILIGREQIDQWRVLEPREPSPTYFPMTTSPQLAYPDYDNKGSDSYMESMPTLFCKESEVMEKKKPKSKEFKASVQPQPQTLQQPGRVARLIFKDEKRPPKRYKRSLIMEERMRERLLRQKGQRALDDYDKNLQQQFDLGFFEEASIDQVNYFLPHFGVHKDNSPTTPLRVVFNGQELNEYLCELSCEDQLLVRIVTRWRNANYWQCFDISKAFPRITMDEESRKYLGFIWRGKVYRWTAMVFGISTSPAWFMSHLREVFRRLFVADPTLSARLLLEPYIDDVTGVSVGKKQDPSQLKADMESVVRSVENDGFPIAREKTIYWDQPDSGNVLGLTWSGIGRDSIRISFKYDGTEVTTRRQLFSLIHSLFDPLGMFLEVDMAARSLVSLSKDYGWDDIISDDLRKLAERWQEFVKKNVVDVESLRKIDTDHVIIFTDASQAAWAVRIFSTCGNVIAGRGGVYKAHQRKWSIVRKELYAILRARDLVKDIRLSNFTLLTDSRVNLERIQAENVKEKLKHWEQQSLLQVRAFMKTTESGQVREIKHISGEFNLADVGSRGVLGVLDHYPVMKMVMDWLKNGKSLPQSKPGMLVKASDPEYNKQVEKLMSSTEEKIMKISVRRLNPILEMERGKEDHIMVLGAEDQRAITPSTEASADDDDDQDNGVQVTSGIDGNQNSSRSNEASSNYSWSQRLHDLFEEELRHIRSSQPNATFEQVRIDCIKKWQQHESLNDLWKVARGEAIPTKLKNSKKITQWRIIFSVGDDGILVRKLKQDSTGKEREQIVVPRISSIVSAIIVSCHNPTHGGVLETTTRVEADWFWFRLKQDVKQMISRCGICALVKRSPGVDGATSSVRKVEAEAWSCVGLDITGPYSPEISSANKAEPRYLLTATCLFSRFFYCEPLVTQSAEEVLQATRKMFAIFGVPVRICCDNGGCFISAIYGDFMTSIGVKLTHIPRYSPQYGGFYERSHGVLHAAMKAVLVSWGFNHKWFEAIPILLHYINTRVVDGDSDGGFTPFQLMFCRQPRSTVTNFRVSDYEDEAIKRLIASKRTGEEVKFRLKESKALWNLYEQKWQQLREKSRLEINRNARPTEESLLKENAVVWTYQPAESKLGVRWEGPWRVLKMYGQVAEVIHIQSGTIRTEHIYNLLPADKYLDSIIVKQKSFIRINSMIIFGDGAVGRVVDGSGRSLWIHLHQVSSCGNQWNLVPYWITEEFKLVAAIRAVGRPALLGIFIHDNLPWKLLPITPSGGLLVSATNILREWFASRTEIAQPVQNRALKVSETTLSVRNMRKALPIVVSHMPEKFNEAKGSSRVLKINEDIDPETSIPATVEVVGVRDVEGVYDVDEAIEPEDAGVDMIIRPAIEVDMDSNGNLEELMIDKAMTEQIWIRSTSSRFGCRVFKWLWQILLCFLKNGFRIMKSVWKCLIFIPESVVRYVCFVITSSIRFRRIPESRFGVSEEFKEIDDDDNDEVSSLTSVGGIGKDDQNGDENCDLVEIIEKDEQNGDDEEDSDFGVREVVKMSSVGALGDAEKNGDVEGPVRTIGKVAEFNSDDWDIYNVLENDDNNEDEGGSVRAIGKEDRNGEVFLGSDRAIDDDSFIGDVFSGSDRAFGNDDQNGDDKKLSKNKTEVLAVTASDNLLKVQLVESKSMRGVRVGSGSFVLVADTSTRKQHPTALSRLEESLKTLLMCTVTNISDGKKNNKVQQRQRFAVAAYLALSPISSIDLSVSSFSFFSFDPQRLLMASSSRSGFPGNPHREPPPNREVIEVIDDRDRMTIRVKELEAELKETKRAIANVKSDYVEVSDAMEKQLQAAHIRFYNAEQRIGYAEQRIIGVEANSDFRGVQASISSLRQEFVGKLDENFSEWDGWREYMNSHAEQFEAFDERLEQAEQRFQDHQVQLDANRMNANRAHDAVADLTRQVETLTRRLAEFEESVATRVEVLEARINSLADQPARGVHAEVPPAAAVVHAAPAVEVLPIPRGEHEQHEDHPGEHHEDHPDVHHQDQDQGEAAEGTQYARLERRINAILEMASIASTRSAAVIRALTASSVIRGTARNNFQVNQQLRDWLTERPHEERWQQSQPPRRW